MHALEESFKSIQGENYSLREYIIHLQSRLIESQGDYPQPPPNVNLSHPHARNHDPHAHRQEGAPVASMSMNALNPSAARSLAAASLNSAKHPQEEQNPYDHKRFKESTNEDAADEDIIRSQLQASADGLPSNPVPM